MKKFKLMLQMFTNSIALVTKYVPVLDAIYAKESLTQIFDATPEQVRYTDQANAVKLAKIAIQGLGTYGRNTGFPSGDVTLTWETHTLSYDRARTFSVDAMDNEETFDISFGMLAGEFIRTKVVPEIDAFRISKIAGLAGNIATPATPDKTNIDTAIKLGATTMTEAKVPKNDRVLLITPTMLSILESSDMYVRNINMATAGAIDNRVGNYDGMPVIEVPSDLMYTAITLYDGTTGGQEAGGYVQGAGKQINFMIVSRSAVLGIKKHVKPRIFAPDTNQTADAWKFDYRIYHDLFVPDNKTDGIYLHNQA